MRSPRLAYHRGGHLDDSWQILRWWRVGSYIMHHTPQCKAKPRAGSYVDWVTFRREEDAAKYAAKVERLLPYRKAYVSHVWVLSYDGGKTGFELPANSVKPRTTPVLRPKTDFEGESA